jgi:hypothetical protein
MDEETRDDAERVARLLGSCGRPPANVAIEAGPSIRDVVLRVAERFGCDVVAVSRKRRPWSTGGIPRRLLKDLRRAAPGRVLELRGVRTPSP